MNHNEIIYSNNSNNLLIDNNKYVYIKDKLNILSNNSNNNYKLCVGGNIYIKGDLNLYSNTYKSPIIIYNQNNLNLIDTFI